MGPQLRKPTPPTGRRPSLELPEERNEGGELAVARTLLSDGTRVYRIGVPSTRASFFEGEISRMSSTTSWVRATYSCHHFRSPFRTAAMLHSTYYFTHLSSYMYS